RLDALPCARHPHPLSEMQEISGVAGGGVLSCRAPAADSPAFSTGSVGCGGAADAAAERMRHRAQQRMRRRAQGRMRRRGYDSGMGEREADFERALHGTHPAPEPTGSRLDDAWRRWMADPRIRRAWDRGAPATVLAVAAPTRHIGLEHPQQIVFDETYYVKDAYTLSPLGYEARWPDVANDSFASGDPDVYLTDGSFIARPPLGKWIIAAAMAAFAT